MALAAILRLLAVFLRRVSELGSEDGLAASRAGKRHRRSCADSIWQVGRFCYSSTCTLMVPPSASHPAATVFAASCSFPFKYALLRREPILVLSKAGRKQGAPPIRAAKPGGALVAGYYRSVVS